MNHFRKIILALLCMIPPAFGILTPKDDIQIKKIEDYFNQLTTLKATFSQFNPNGSLAEGRFFLSRPGKMRIEYLKPDEKLIIADSEWFIYHDIARDETSHLPLESSPAYIILQKNVSFTNGVKVVHYANNNGIISITLVRDNEEEAGKLTLVFQQTPLTLKEWIIVDAQGLQTIVRLENLTKGIRLDGHLFKFDKFKF